MIYLESFNQLKAVQKLENKRLQFSELDIHSLNFESKSQHLLPGYDSYYCHEHEVCINETNTFLNNLGEINSKIHIKDGEIDENQRFSYRIFMPRLLKKASKCIFLFHGFNEKNWDKYFPWAQYLATKIQCAVILFPIAFHMNRTLSIWSDKRRMFALSQQRKTMFPNVVDSSLSNVAISLRLHAMPQRFIWSGLQTYYDVIQFIEECKANKHPLVSADAQFHMVAYSIGCLLAEILKLTNYRDYFKGSKLCMFCGGAVFNRLSPVSKYILDSEANIALYSYMIEHIKKHMEKDGHLKHYIDGEHLEGRIFYSMLDYKEKRSYREKLFNNVSNDLLAITLKQDTIIPAYEIINTLQGAARDIPIPVDVYDFPFKYDHVIPFPSTEKNKELIDEHFQKVFSRIAEFIVADE